MGLGGFLLLVFLLGPFNYERRSEMTEEKHGAWANRIVIEIHKKAWDRIKKGKRAQTMKDGVWYELIPKCLKTITLSDGRVMNKTALKKLLRSM